MTAKLIAEEGLLKELQLSFEEGDQWVIGRDPDACQFLVEDPAASRRHALIRRTPEGLVIENLSQTNPVVVNEDAITEPRLLLHGDIVKIGDSHFRFYTSEEVKLFEENSETNISDTPQQPFPSQVPPATIDEGPPPEKAEKEKTHDTIFDEEGDKPEIAHVNLDLIESGRWLLKVIGGPNNGAEFSMQSGSSYVIGTDPNTCDIVFYDNSVSRQHARINISPEEKLTIEDLRSRNGTRVDGELITNPLPLPFNTMISMGTTSFIVYDREGEMQTIISPLLPSIVKVLQKEEERIKEAIPDPSGIASETIAVAAAPIVASLEVPIKSTHPHPVGALLLTSILIGLFAIIGVAVQTLFVQEPIKIEKTIDMDQALGQSLSTFPSVKSSFNKATGRLLLVGHVLTQNDKNQMIYALQGLPFIKEIDDSGVIIDEFVINEANQVLTKNPKWKSVTVQSPSPGHFAVTGYLQTSGQAEEVWDYLLRNFPYIDLLENKLVVEENILNSVNNMLHNQGFNNITSRISNGDLILNGTYPIDKKANFESLTKEFRNIQGVRAISNLASQQAPSEAIINISDKYLVTGSSRADGGQLNVVINGRILTVGDILDGMRITSIEPNKILLERGAIIYRIDFGR